MEMKCSEQCTLYLKSNISQEVLEEVAYLVNKQPFITSYEFKFDDYIELTVDCEYDYTTFKIYDKTFEYHSLKQWEVNCMFGQESQAMFNRMIAGIKSLGVDMI